MNKIFMLRTWFLVTIFILLCIPSCTVYGMRDEKGNLNLNSEDGEYVVEARLKKFFNGYDTRTFWVKHSLGLASVIFITYYLWYISHDMPYAERAQLM